jgi:ligand-binding sensor domain-containing protein
MNHRFNHFLLTGIFLLFFLHGFAQPPGYRYFKLEKDNKPVKINCLYRDHNGYLLVGADNGLYKFDGEKYIPVYFSNKEYTDTATAIFEDSRSKIWVGFKSGRIASINDKKLVYFNPEEGTPAKKITAFAEDKEKNLWFSTAGEGVYFMQNGHLYLINEEDGLSDLNVNCLVASGNGEMLAGTDQGINICTVNKNKKNITVIGTRQGLPDNIITSIVPMSKNLYWVGLQEKGFCLFELAHRTITVPEPVKNWVYGQVNELLRLPGTLWIATEGKGVFSYQYETGRIDSIPVQATGPVINRMIHDLQGNAWLSSAEFGLVRTAGESIRFRPIPGNPVFEHVHTLLSERNGNIWTNDQLNRLIMIQPRDGNGSGRLLQLQGVNEKTDITALYQDQNGHIWVGTMGRGLYIVDPQTFRYRAFTENNLFINGGILSVSGKGDQVFVSSLQGSMAVTTESRNKDIMQPYRFVNYNSKSTGTNYIYSIFQDSRNRIWFATDGNGLTLLQDNQFSYFHEKNKIRDDHVYSVTEDQAGNIWFSTASAGIYKYDGKTFINYGLKEGLSDLNISVLKTDRAGHIIIVHKKGLDILNPSTGSISYLDNSQGIGTVNAEDLGAVTQDSSGNIMVNTSNGILTYSFPPDAVQQPNAIIESVQLFLNDINDNRKAVYKHDENNFTFNYAGLYYTDPERVYYEYKLEGLDSNWILTKDRSKNFPKLEPGSYTFRIRASLNRNFRLAHEASYTFVIKKAIYKEGWFLALCGIFIALLLYWYIKNRERSLKKMERLRQEKIQFQFETLRTQVNPHFLFNSFNTLISTIEDDPAMAVEYAGMLADFFRDIIHYREKEVISLKEETRLLMNYFHLQQKRYGPNLQISINISPGQLNDYSIPPLTLQLLVENAIKHNEVSEEKLLAISLEIVNDEKLLVKNNINARRSKQVGAGMGLQNIMNRYNLLSNKKVEITETNDSFIVSLPLLKN